MVGFMNPWIYMYDADIVWDQPDEELLLKFSIPFNSKELEEQGKIKQDRTVRLPSPHGFRDVKGRRKQGDDGQTAEVPKKKTGWAGKRKVWIKK